MATPHIERLFVGKDPMYAKPHKVAAEDKAVAEAAAAAAAEARLARSLHESRLGTLSKIQVSSPAPIGVAGRPNWGGS